MTTSSTVVPALDFNRLIPAGHISRIHGRLERTGLGWAGRMGGVLSTSIGEVEFIANRDNFRVTLVPGDWVTLRLMHRHDKQLPWVLRADRATPGAATAWVPDADCHRREHLQRLRHLLGQLTPAMQAFFIAALPDGTSQRRLFGRLAAVDHHVYPGGLFDQSVEAAEHAFGCSQLSERNRGIAALAAMLFDIGKLADPKLGLDFSREGPGLAPHPLTRVRALRACDAVEPLDAELSATLRRLLTAYDGPDGTEHLRYVVHRAVARSWSTEPRLRLPREQR